MAIEIVNRQRRRKVNAKQWREFAEQASSAIGVSERDLTIVFVSDAAMRKLNLQFRGRDYATDVLSFPAQPESFERENTQDLGEVVISLERAARQANEHGLTVGREIRQLILHGLLHLCGYDHETDCGEMDRFELELRRKLKI
jgi:probable rRNA maturation factor